MGVNPFSPAFNFQFGDGLIDSYIMGLSLTRPDNLGHNITEPTWTTYTRELAIMDPLGPTFANTNEVEFITNIPPNTYYVVPYFVLWDSGGNFAAAGSITGLIEVGPSATITFAPLSILSTLNSVTYVPNTSNIAFSLVTYPPFTPTYEPASLSRPILYQLNMRS